MSGRSWNGAAGLVVLACASACSGPAASVPSASVPSADVASYDDEPCLSADSDAGVPAIDVAAPVATFTMRPGDPPRRLADGCTTIEMRIVHPTVSLGDGGLYGVATASGGLPYVRTHGGWLEILHAVTLYDRGHVYAIENAGCATVTRSCGDCFYEDVDSCALTVTTTSSRPPAAGPAPVDHLFSLDSRYDAFRDAGSPGSGGWAALRGLGFDVGNLDTTQSPPELMGLTGGMDLVTSFGVANVDFDYFNTQVIGVSGQATIGPHQITWTLEDVGNGNTHCSGAGGCRDVFDLAVKAEVTDDATRVPAILSYR